MAGAGGGGGGSGGRVGGGRGAGRAGGAGAAASVLQHAGNGLASDDDLVHIGTAGALPRRVLRMVFSFLCTAEAVSRSRVCKSLHGELLSGRDCLDLAGWTVPAAAFAALVAGSASTLRRLDLYCARADVAIRAVCAQPLPHMQHLSLFGVSTAWSWSPTFDVAAVARHCLAMPELRTVDLRWNRLGLTQVVTLLQVLQGCPQLETVNLKYNAVSQRALRKLQKRLPDVKFEVVA
jgi:hypothetical protein